MSTTVCCPHCPATFEIPAWWLADIQQRLPCPSCGRAVDVLHKDETLAPRRPTWHLYAVGPGSRCGADKESHLMFLADDGEQEHLDFHLGVAMRLAIDLGEADVADALLEGLKKRIAAIDFSGHPEEREAASRMLAESGEAVRAIRDRAQSSS